MIRDLSWRKQLMLDVSQRLGVVHGDLANIVELLRDQTVEVWTESPSDPTRRSGTRSYSLEGWRSHFKNEGQRITQFRVDNRARLAALDADMGSALDGYVASLPNIAIAFNQLMANYVDGQGNIIQKLVTQAHRAALANAIEAELE